MSAPDTNLERQKKRHVAPLIGMGAAALFGLALLLFWLMGAAGEADNPAGADTLIDGRTGAPSVTSQPATTQP